MTVLLVPWWLTPAIASQEQHLLLVLLLLSVCKSLQRSLILCAPQGVSLESGCKSTAFRRTHQIFSEKNARKIRFLTNNWFRSSIWRENKRKKGQKEVRKEDSSGSCAIWKIIAIVQSIILATIYFFLNLRCRGKLYIENVYARRRVKKPHAETFGEKRLTITKRSYFIHFLWLNSWILISLT